MESAFAVSGPGLGRFGAVAQQGELVGLLEHSASLGQVLGKERRAVLVVAVLVTIPLVQVNGESADLATV